MSAVILKGAPVAKALNERTATRCEALHEAGVVPTLAIVRVGAREDDLSYERAAEKRCAAVGIEVRKCVLPQDVPQETLINELDRLSGDSGVHGILVFQPLPKHIDSDAVRRAIVPEKDVDGVTEGSLAGVFTGSGRGFAPCTAQACMELLDYYNIDCAGKNAVVIGRSLVIGRPAAMLLMAKNATVTICHTGTKALPGIASRADIIIAAAGRAETVGKEYLSQGQVVIDVGIHVGKDGAMCGDVKFDEAESIVGAVTPVPGGVGGVTTSVLAEHVVSAAERASK